MLYEIFLRNKYLITFTYIVLAFEESLISMIPYFLGLAVDSILVKDLNNFYIYLVVCSTAVTVAIIRKLWDTRLYSRIWSRIAKEKIDGLIEKKVERPKIVSRIHMLSEYTRFYENAIPDTLTAVIDIVISFGILIYFVPLASLIIAILTLLSIAVHYKQSLLYQDYTNKIQLANEKMNDDIINIDNPALEQNLDEIAKNLVKFSDVDSYVYGIHEFFATTAEIVLIFSLINHEVSTGLIMANVTYVFKIFMHVNSIGRSLMHFKVIKAYDNLLH